MTVEVCCYFYKARRFNRSDYGDETDATHLLEDLIILIIIQVF
jgi:hypothetical protein